MLESEVWHPSASIRVLVSILGFEYLYSRVDAIQLKYFQRFLYSPSEPSWKCASPTTDMSSSQPNCCLFRLVYVLELDFRHELPLPDGIGGKLALDFDISPRQSLRLPAAGTGPPRCRWR